MTQGCRKRTHTMRRGGPGESQSQGHCQGTESQCRETGLETTEGLLHGSMMCLMSLSWTEGGQDGRF